MHIKQRMTVMSAVLAVLALGIGGGVGIPSVLAIKKTLVDIGSAQKKLDERYALRRYMSRAAADIAEKKKRVAPLAESALQEGAELEFVRAVETSADESLVTSKLTLETANQRVLSAWENEIPVTIVATGSYPNVLRFAESLERMRYLVDVGSLIVTPQGAGATGSTVTLEMHGLVYWIGKSAPDFVHGRADAIPLPADIDAPAPTTNK